jgi:hypothetical protein
MTRAPDATGQAEAALPLGPSRWQPLLAQVGPSRRFAGAEVFVRRRRERRYLFQSAIWNHQQPRLPRAGVPRQLHPPCQSHILAKVSPSDTLKKELSSRLGNNGLK